MYRSRAALALAILFALVAVAPAAHAESITAAASGGQAENPTSDVQGPADSGQLLAQVTVPGDGFATLSAAAALDIHGNSALSLQGVYSTTGKPRTAGTTFPQVTDGVTTWTTSVTNTSPLPKRYRYSFLLHPIRIELRKGDFSVDDPLVPSSSFAVEVRANGSLVFQSHALLKGGFHEHALVQSGVNLGGVFGDDEGRLWYDFPQFPASVAIGHVGPGDTITIETKLIGHTESRVDRSGGDVSMGDPLDLKGDPGLSSATIGEDEEIGVTPLTWSATKSLYR